MKKEVILNILLSIGMLALLVSAFLPLVLNSYSLYPWLRYIFVAAAFIIVVVRVLQRLGSRKVKKSHLGFVFALRPLSFHMARLPHSWSGNPGIRLVYD